MLHSSEDDLSDDEIFFGKLTIRELKKYIMLNNHEQSKTSSIRKKPFVESSSDCKTSIKIIESHSQPNPQSSTVNCHNFLLVPGTPAAGKITSNESFTQMENMVPKLCISPGKTKSLELNSTLEVIQNIPNKGPEQNINKETKTEVINYNMSSEMNPLSLNKILTPQQTSTIKKEDIAIEKSPQYLTPLTIKKQQADIFATPASSFKTKKSLFRTPANYLSQKKTSLFSFRKAPSETNAFQFVKSPVASYINNSSEQLLKNAYPRKPLLPGPSSIPKLVKNTPKLKIQNKENINLPSVAYKSAMKTKIHIPDGEKLPQSQKAKKVLSALPRPMKIKHEETELNISKNQSVNIQNDSLQAEVSVGTEKSASKTKKTWCEHNRM